MDGIATDLDQPGAEKLYTHVDVVNRLSTEVDSRVPSSSGSSDIQHEEDLSTSSPAPLTPVASRLSRPSLSREVSLARYTTQGTAFTSDPSLEVDFESELRDNPRDWPAWYKGLVVIATAFATLGVVVLSTSYTATLPPMKAEFHVSGDTIPTLGLTTYLFGLAIGSLVLAPLSETYGRKPVYMIAMSIYTLLIIPCALARNLTTIIVVRLFVAIAGSAMIANAPGSLGDIVSDEYRSIVFSIWSVAPLNGPVLGPIFGGYITERLGWRWANWLSLVWGAISCIALGLLKETYAPRILQQKAKKRRSQTGEQYWSRYDIRLGFVELMKVNLSRPLSMAVKEPICMFFNLFIGVVYGILYLCFTAYPFVFSHIRGWSTATSSLAFLGIGIGNLIAIACASPIKKMINSHKRDASGQIPPEASMSVVCIAAILIPVGELWFAWTCLPTSLNPLISIAAGIPFGMGNCVVFIYATNYLVHSYGIYAASALAGNAVVRSVLGGVMPLAATVMYQNMGAHWAGTLLGLLEVALIPIPFIFYRYGYKIREKSKLIREMREIEVKAEAKRRKMEAKLRREGQVNGPQGMSEKVMEIDGKEVRAEVQMDMQRGLIGPPDV